MRRCRRWFCLATLLAALVMACAHRPLLRAVACGLIVDEPILNPDAVWVRRGDHRYDVAASLYQQDPSRRMIVIERFPERVMQLGLVPTNVEVDRRELAKRGVPESAIDVLPAKARTVWDKAGALAGWLADHPHARVAVLDDRFRSRKLRYVLDTLLPAEDRRRVSVRALPDRRVDEHNWWQSRDGIEWVVDAYLRLAYIVFHGPDSETPPPWDFAGDRSPSQPPLGRIVP